MQGVHFTGMENDERDALHALFHAANADLGKRFSLVDDEQAQILIVDVDSIYGQMTWLRARGDTRVVIPLSAGNRADGGLALTRPVTRDTLAQLLRALAPQPGAATPGPDAQAAAATEAAVTQPQPAAPTEPVRAPEPEVHADAPPPPRLGDWLEPGALSQVVRVTREGAEPLVLDPGTRMYFGHGALKSLLPYCHGEMSEAELVAVPAAEFEQIVKRGGAQPMARLRWLFALVAGEGKLMPGHEVHERYSLNKWPQIEREFPKHFRIATAMMKGPATPAEIAALSSSPENEVIDFINASLVAGFASVERPEPEAESPPARAGLFDRLRGKKA